MNSTQPLAVPQFRGRQIDQAIREDYLGFLTSVAGQCGDIGSYERAGQPVVLINAPGLIQTLLIERAHHFDKGPAQHTTFRKLLGQSLSLAEGARHRHLRRLLTPSFGRRRLVNHVDRIAQTAERHVDSWPRYRELALFDALSRLTLHTFGQTLIDDPGSWDEAGDFWRAREDVWRWMNQMAGSGRSLGRVSPAELREDRRVGEAIATLQEHVDARIQTRRRRPDLNQIDLLDELLVARDRGGCMLGDADVRDHILAFLFAAHDTSAAALFWGLHLLSHHPSIYCQLETEVDAVLGERLPTAQDLPLMPYSLRVLKEAMRLYPPAGRQFRVALCNTRLGSYGIPAGTPVSICQYLLHRRPDFAPHPERFDPNRFHVHRKPRHPFAYLPFGGGERICLGRHYALLELQVTLILIIQRLRLSVSPQPSVRPMLAVTLRPDNDLVVRVQTR